jgi:hypothetical protein
MAKLAPPATMKSPVRAALRGRPGPASQELFSEENAVPDRAYSYRSAVIGSISIARRAGKYPAAAPAI